MKITEKAEVSIESKFKSKKIELQIMKYILTVAPGICTGVDGKWFSIKPLQNIFDISKSLRVCFTQETMLHELKKSGVFQAGKSGNDGLKDVYIHYVNEIFRISLNGVNSSSIRVLVRQLYELSESRDVLYTIKNIVKNIDSFNIDKVKQKFKYLSRDRFETDEILSGNYLDDYEARLKAVEEKTEEGEVLIPTGISKFDWQIGGIMPGEFGVIIGRTGLGKTAMLVCMALHAWMKGFNVAFATGEMRKILIQYRMDANIAHVESDKFRTGKFEMEDFKKWAKTIDGLRQICDSYLEVGSFSRNFNTDNLEDWLHKLDDKHGKPVDVLFVDYLNIMDSIKSKKDRGEWQSQSNAVWDLKTLTETYNEGRICTWTAGQIIDAFYNAEKLTLDAPKYARAISETAPIICGLVQTEDDILYNTMQLQILKMRNSSLPKDSILLHPDLNFMRINDRAKSRYKSLLDLDVRPKKKIKGGKKRSLLK